VGTAPGSWLKVNFEIPVSLLVSNIVHDKDCGEITVQFFCTPCPVGKITEKEVCIAVYFWEHMALYFEYQINKKRTSFRLFFLAILLTGCDVIWLTLQNNGICAEQEIEESTPPRNTEAYETIPPTHIKLLMFGDDNLMNLK